MSVSIPSGFIGTPVAGTLFSTLLSYADGRIEHPLFDDASTIRKDVEEQTFASCMELLEPIMAFTFNLINKLLDDLTPRIEQAETCCLEVQSTIRGDIEARLVTLESQLADLRRGLPLPAEEDIILDLGPTEPPLVVTQIPSEPLPVTDIELEQPFIDTELVQRPLTTLPIHKIPGEPTYEIPLVPDIGKIIETIARTQWPCPTKRNPVWIVKDTTDSENPTVDIIYSPDYPTNTGCGTLGPFYDAESFQSILDTLASLLASIPLPIGGIPAPSPIVPLPPEALPAPETTPISTEPTPEELPSKVVVPGVCPVCGKDTFGQCPTGGNLPFLLSDCGRAFVQSVILNTEITPQLLKQIGSIDIMAFNPY